MARILAFAGSTRSGSMNQRLLDVAASAVEAAGADVTRLSLRDYVLPLYEGDLEAQSGMPAAADGLRKAMREHDGFLIASPEYNSSITPLLKNAIDWVSRPSGDVPALAAFGGKTAALLAASPGALGGLRGLVHVRSILSSIGVLVLPNQVALPKAHEAFEDSGVLRDAHLSSRVDALARELAETTARLVG